MRKPSSGFGELNVSTRPGPQLEKSMYAWVFLERFLKVNGQPVHLVYFTTTVDEDGAIRHFRDIYDRDPAVWRALQQAAAEAGAIGLETAALAQ